MNDTNALNTLSDSESDTEPYRTVVKKPYHKKDKNLISFRTASRLMTVQSLYVMALTEKRPSEVIEDLQLLPPITPSNYEKPEILIPDNFDADYTLSILYGVVREQRAIDPLISDFLPDDWQLGRLDKVMCAILRAAVYELLFSPDIPTKVVINEYTNIASSFNLNHENSLVNGVLNAIARENNLI